MRGGINNPEEQNAEENEDYVNLIKWFGCPPNKGVDAVSTISAEFFKVLKKVANKMTGRVILPDNMLRW